MIEFEKPTVINCFLVQEYMPLGQRVQEFTVEAFVDGKWNVIAKETTIGAKRILRFEPVEVEKVRFTVMKSKACLAISNLELYHAPAVMIEPKISRNKQGVVIIKAFGESSEVFYTVDGKDPVKHGKLFSEPFGLKSRGTVKAVIKDKSSGKYGPVATVEFDVCKDKWIVRKGDKNSNKAIDGNPATTYSIVGSKLPLGMVIDLGETLNIKGFTYLPDQSRWSKGIVKEYAFYVSKNGILWGKPESKGEFANIKNSPVWQKKEFEPVTGRYVKFQALSEVDGANVMSIAEIGVITE